MLTKWAVADIRIACCSTERQAEQNIDTGEMFTI